MLSLVNSRMDDSTAVTKTRRKGRILVVEDDKNVRSGLALMLQSWGFTVLQAEDARDGLIKAMSQNPQLVILDIIMPVRSGFQVCKKLKEDDRYKKIPVFVLSALPVDQQKKGAPGADAYMTKPYKARELLDTIDGLLGGREATTT